MMNDRVVLITGGTSGLGKALVLLLLKRGYRVAFCGRSEKKLQEVLHEIKGISKVQYYYQLFDITCRESIFSFIQNVERELGTIEILINNAGLNRTKSRVVDIGFDDLDWMMKVNFYAPLAFIQGCYSGMKGIKESLIVNILSSSCLFSNEGGGGYSSSKSALDSLTKVLRKELRHDEIRVCSVYSGGIDTPFRSVANHDYLKPEPCAQAILNLIELDPSIAPHEFVFRPMGEENFP